MVRYKKKLPMKSPRAAVTAAPPSAGDQSLGLVSRSTCSQQRLQNDDTASLSASARTVAVAIADGDISEKSNEDDTDKEEDNEEEDKDVGKGEDSDNEGSKEDDRNKTEGEAQANRFESIVDSSLLEDDVPSQSFRVPWVRGKGAGRKANKGRPPCPDTANMTEFEAEMAIKKWQVEWKQKRDKDRRKGRKEDSDGVFIDEGNTFTGCIDTTLRRMVDVRKAPLLLGHTFPFKDMLMMRIAEEANLYGVRVKTTRSDSFQLCVKGVDGDSFHVKAVYGTQIGLWKVIECNIRINREVNHLLEDGSDAKAKNANTDLPGGLEDLDDRYLDPPPLGESVAGVFDGIDEGIADDYGNEGDDDKKKESSDLADSPSKKVRVKSPIKAKWLLPIVHSSIADRPNISYKELHELVKVCAALQFHIV